MSNRKIILYPKSAMKPIILTDSSNEPLEKIQEHVIDVLKDTKITILSTTNDSLIVRPSEIQAVLITKKDDDNSKSTSKYQDSLEESNDSINN